MFIFLASLYYALVGAFLLKYKTIDPAYISGIIAFNILIALIVLSMILYDIYCIKNKCTRADKSGIKYIGYTLVLISVYSLLSNINNLPMPVWILYSYIATFIIFLLIKLIYRKKY